MSSKTTNRVIQIALLLTWITIVVLRYPSFVSSQSCIHPKYAHQPPHVNSWLVGMQVSVQIDDFFTDDQKGGLEWGNTAWNNAGFIRLRPKACKFHL